MRRTFAVFGLCAVVSLAAASMTLLPNNSQASSKNDVDERRQPSSENDVPEPRRERQRYDDLDPEEVVSLLQSLESSDLLALRDHERAELARPRVLAAIDGVLAQREATHAR